MKNIPIIFLTLVTLIIFPGAVIYLGGAFVQLSWSWIIEVDMNFRLSAILILIGLWVVLSYIAITGSCEEDDRRNPNKKSNAK